MCFFLKFLLICFYFYSFGRRKDSETKKYRQARPDQNKTKQRQLLNAGSHLRMAATVMTGSNQS